MKNVLIIGATGFGGLGLIELILNHPEFNIKQLVARKDSGKKVSDVFPHLKGFCDIIVDDSKDIVLDDIDLAFFSTPDRAGMTLIEDFHKANIPVIDFSGDFRFHSTEDYEIYAKNKSMQTEHLSKNLLKDSVYGLPEKYFTKIQKSNIIGNPGCFAISMILALLPAMEENIIAGDTIICDGKTGVSGAGKNSGETNLYPQRYENANTYREGHHQHTVEVENIINLKNSTSKKILFIPQIVPINRGILMTSYAEPKNKISTKNLDELYREYYKKAPFVKIIESSPNTAYVRKSNFCHIRPMIDERTGKIFITSVIDNLMKGQAGNAIQNANIRMGFDETLGLDFPANYP